MKKILNQHLAIRLFHWPFAALMVIEIITGLFISFGISFPPFFNFRAVRLAHIATGITALYLVIFRIYYAFFTGDYKNFSLSRRDVSSAVELVKYYLFIRKTPPRLYGKYNTGQKLVYLSWALMVLYLSAAGIVLLYTEPTGLPAKLLGGYQLIRLSKLIGTVYFMVSVTVHVYLIVTEDPAKLQAMVTGWLRVAPGEKTKPKE